MHFLKLTALATALAALVSTSPVPADDAIIRRDRAVVEGAGPLDPKPPRPYYKEKQKRDRAIVDLGAVPEDPKPPSRYRKRDRAIVDVGAVPEDPNPKPPSRYRRQKQRRDDAIVEVEGEEKEDALGSLEAESEVKKRGTYSKYENMGPYVPMSDEMEV